MAERNLAESTYMDPDSMTIGRKKYPFREEELHHSSLRFFPENPRIYSLLVINGQVPEQKEIEQQLTGMDHVRILRSSIEQNGGLIDPLIVRDGDFVVLEGNSRLAAYRMLAKKDPFKWSLVRCRILPADISDAAIFALLGQYHIVGRKDWNPFEQAGYLWRRMNAQEISPEQLVKEIGGLSVPKIKKMVEVYDFMNRHEAIDPQKWSYYEEYLKSRNINKVRKELPELDTRIVEQIKSGEISQAIDIRHKLEPITRIESPKKRKRILKSLIDEEASLDECFEEAELTGVNVDILKGLIIIKKKLLAMDIKRNKLTEEERKKCQFELKKISSLIKDIEKEFSA